MHSCNTCLSDVEIGSYIEERLSPEERKAVEKRLEDCNECRKDLIGIRELLGKEDVLQANDAPEHLIKRAINMYPDKEGMFDVVFRIIRDAIEIVRSSTRINVLAPAAGTALRGVKVFSPTMITLTKSFDDIDVELNVEKISGDLCNAKVLVAGTTSKPQVNNLMVELISQGRELASSFPKKGEVIFEDIPYGRYCIKIRRKEKVFGELTFKIV